MMIADLVRNDAAWPAVMDGVPATSPCRTQHSPCGRGTGVSPRAGFDSDGVADHCRHRSRRVWQRWNDEDVRRVIASGPFGGSGTTVEGSAYSATPKPVSSPASSPLPRAQALIDDRLAGPSACASHLADGGGRLSSAVLDEAVVRDGAEATVVGAGSRGGSRGPAGERQAQAGARTTAGTGRLA